MKDVRAHLATLGKDALVDLLIQQAMSDDRLQQQLLLETAQSIGGGENVHAFRAAITNAIETGGYVDYYGAYDYSSRIDDVVTSLEKLLKNGKGEAVIELTEHALTLLEHAIESVDDSDGNLSFVFERLHALHLSACTKVRPDPVVLARKLFAWELRSEWEVFYGAAQTYAKVLGATGLAAYRKLANAEWAQVPALTADQQHRFGRSSRFRITAIMEALASVSGDIEELVAVKQRDLSLAYHYLTIAELYENAGKRKRALEWAEQGINAFPDRTDSRLRLFLAKLYEQIDRHDDAIVLVWQNFIDRPCLEHFEELRHSAKQLGEWDVWRPKALEAARPPVQQSRANSKQTSLFRHTTEGTLLVQLLLSENDIDAAWSAAETFGCTTEHQLQLARKREPAHPSDAARVYQEDVERLLDRRNNSAYEEAVQRLRDVKRAMKGLLAAQRSEYFVSVRVRHKAKRNFIKLLDAAKL